MLDMMEIMQLMADGKPLPQEKHRVIPDSVVDSIGRRAHHILNGILLAVPMDMSDREMEDIEGEIHSMFNQHGWYQTSGILAMHWGYAAVGFDMASIPATGEPGGKDVDTLAKCFQLAGSHMEEDEGAWTIPLAMLASSSEEIAFRAIIRTLVAAAGQAIQQAGKWEDSEHGWIQYRRKALARAVGRPKRRAR